MSNRHDEGFSSGFGFGYDPYLDWEGPHAIRGGVFRDPSRSRRYLFDDEMGNGGFWGGFTGRGGMTDRFYERSPYDRSFNTYERNLHDRNVGFFGSTPYDRHDRNVGFFGSTPYDRHVGNVGFFGSTPYDHHAAQFGMMNPYDRHIANMGLFGMNPYDRHIANMGLFGMNAFDRNVANTGLFGMNAFDRNVANLGLLGMTPFSAMTPWERNAALFGMPFAGATQFNRNAAVLGMTPFSAMTPWERNAALFGMPFAGATQFDRNAAILGMAPFAAMTPWERNAALFGAPFAQNVGTFGTPFGQNVGSFGTPWERNIGTFGTPFAQNIGAFGMPWERNVGLFGMPFAQNVGVFGMPFAQNVGAFGMPFAQNVGAFGAPWERNVGLIMNPWERAAAFAGHPYERAAFAQSHLGGIANPFGGADRFSHFNDPSFNELNQGWNIANARSPFFGRDRVPFARGEHDFWPVDRFGMNGFGMDAWGDAGFAFGDERGPHFNRGPKGYKRPDERIREEVCDVIARQGFIDASDVEVFVESGVVRLVGSVAQRREKRALEQIIERIYGVDEVRNELRLNHNANAERFQSRLAAERQVVQPHNGKNARA